MRVLSDILHKLIEELDIAVFDLDVRPMPLVARCKCHMIDHGIPRYYLLARFLLRNGSERYLLEIDASDIRKLMSTQVMGLKEGVESRVYIKNILASIVKRSLCWPKRMDRYCDPLHLVSHPENTHQDDCEVRLYD